MSTRVRVYAVAVGLLLAQIAIAANNVSWNAGYPSSGVGTIKGMGTFTIDPGYTVVSGSITATPTAGGAPSTSIAPAQNLMKTWGPGTVTVSKGQYTVIVTLNFRNDKTGVVSPVNGPVSQISVP